MRIHAVLVILFGLAFVLLTAPLLALYGVSLSEAGEFISRLTGAAFIGVALVSWFAADAGPSQARDAILLGFGIGEAIGFVVALVGQLSGVVNALGWSTVILYLLFALGNGYFRFMNPESS
jgi:hypothetical protein